MRTNVISCGDRSTRIARRLSVSRDDRAALTPVLKRGELGVVLCLFGTEGNTSLEDLESANEALGDSVNKSNMRWLLTLLLISVSSLVHGLSSSGSRLLVVIEEAADQEKYSQFWSDLRGRGYSITFESPKNEKLALLKHDELAFDHVILLPPKSKGLGPALTPKLLLDFVNKNGNILLALSGDSSTPTAISSLLLELDIQLPPDRTSLVVDHFNYDTISSSEKHDVLLLPQPSSIRTDVRQFFGGDGTIAFPRAVAQELGNLSPLLAPILQADSTAYSYNPKEEADTVEDPFATGSQIALVSAMQARNSARFTVLGSVEALENVWFDAFVQGVQGPKGKTANREFARQLSEWTFMETGVLKVGRVEHHLSSIEQEKSGNNSVTKLGYLNPKIYRVKNDVTFTVELSEYTQTHWSPPTIPASDALQLEFTMLSPFHRLALLPVQFTPNSTLYSTTFTLPDQHGIFAFKVNYKRPFMTSVDVKREVTVRHFAHDEWPRSWMISGGWVWIAGIWVTIAGWVAFAAIWLWSEPAFDAARGKKIQ
ncbi:oligosaccharyl transferase glycoprotein complex, beta subunit [Xylographa pallens]|nr:oligosaccharyl transferase glycoprotein complex, beta subunit [Xylographa pallens]